MMSAKSQHHKPALWKARCFSVDAREYAMDGHRASVDGATSPVSFVTGSPVAADDAFPSHVQTGPRRGSFLFRPGSSDAGTPHITTTITGSVSAVHLTTLLPSQLDTHTEERLIVTPFAQILHRLQTARNSYSQLTNVAGTNNKRSHNTPDVDVLQSHVEFPDETTKELAVDILNDLDWCLDQLESMQTHRSVSNMTTNKFTRMLNRELNQLAVSSKSGSQVSEYIHNTFLETDVEAEAEPREQVSAARDDAGRNQDNGSCQATSMMSHVTGVRRARTTSTGGGGSSASKLDVPPPTYGVADVPDSILMEAMSAIDQWGVDMFSLDSLVNGHSLVAVTYTVLKEHEMLRKFELSARTILNYLSEVEDHYRNVPYHNHVHAADVTQSIHSMLSIPALQNVFTDLEVLGVILACAIHDVDHPGVTNQYLINTGSELALMYNDESVLENHHLAVAFKLLQDSACDVFKPLSAKTRHRLRRIVIDLVLSTDMSKHMGLLADLKTMVETKKVTGSGALVLDSFTDRMQVLQNMIHCADLSNPMKPLNLYRQWTDRIMQEFFEQGDIERELGLDISPMCDRHTATVAKSQVGFIDFIVHPLWETWADLVHPYCAELLDTLEDNRIWYSSRIADSSTSSSGAASARQVASPTTEDGPSGGADDPRNDSAAADGRTSTTVESDIDEEVPFVAMHHPDGVQSTLTLSRTLSHGIPETDERCRHPEIRRASSTEFLPLRVSAVQTMLRGCISVSNVAIDGGPRRHKSSPDTFHKSVVH